MRKNRSQLDAVGFFIYSVITVLGALVAALVYLIRQ